VQISIYQIDAFTNETFGGNPAAVCPLNAWLPDEMMQKIAAENCVAETAFFVEEEDGYRIRWFTPRIEMDLCGHATLASAHVIANHLNKDVSTIKFYSHSGILNVTVSDQIFTLDFPSRKPEISKAPQLILDAFKQKPLQVLKSRDFLLVYENESEIKHISPNQTLLDQINLDPGGIIVTAPGDNVDFVSRFFTPQADQFEDPVTGSAHCSLIPYWSERLAKTKLTALQISQRAGKLICEDKGERVLIGGQAVTYMEGFILV